MIAQNPEHFVQPHSRRVQSGAQYRNARGLTTDLSERITLSRVQSQR